jgi:hypothetical protein
MTRCVFNGLNHLAASDIAQVLFAKRAREQGVDVDLQVWPFMYRGWQQYEEWHPEGRAALIQARSFVANLQQREMSA